MYVGISIDTHTIQTTNYEICNMLVSGYENLSFGYINLVISKIVENTEIIVTVNCFYFDRIIIIFNIFIIQIRNAEKNGSQTCPGDDPPVRRHLSHSARGT